MSTPSQYRYEPDVVSPPGETLQELLDARGISQTQLAERTGKHVKNINAIVQGKEAITPATALLFERALGVPADFWNEREKAFRASLARAAATDDLKAHTGLLEKYPLKEMSRLGWLPAAGEPVAMLDALLRFFGVASPAELETCWMGADVAFRASPAFQSEPAAVAAWLRRGETLAETLDCQPYDEAKFRAFLQEARGWTVEAPDSFVPKLQTRGAACGVAVVFVPELPGTHLSGARLWTAPDRARIQLSVRHKTDDHLWFTFFHEAAHVLKHPKRDVFIDTTTTSEDPREVEANTFACEWMIPAAGYREFVASGSFTETAVRNFAAGRGIAPGIVVGRLQHDRHLGFARLNHLKRRFKWAHE